MSTKKKSLKKLTKAQLKVIGKRTAQRVKALSITINVTPDEIAGKNPQLLLHKRTVRQAELLDTDIIARSLNKEWTLTSIASYSSSRDLCLLPLKENMPLYLDSLGDLFQVAYLSLVENIETILEESNERERVAIAFGITRKAMRHYIGSLDAFNVKKADKRFIKEIQLSNTNPITGKPLDLRTAQKMVASMDRDLDYFTKTSTGWREAVNMAIDEPAASPFDFETVIANAVDTLSKNEIVVLKQILEGKKTLASVRKGYGARADKLTAFILDYCKANHHYTTVELLG
jgi:hypothetical protein